MVDNRLIGDGKNRGGNGALCGGFIAQKSRDLPGSLASAKYVSVSIQSERMNEMGHVGVILDSGMRGSIFQERNCSNLVVFSASEF